MFQWTSCPHWAPSWTWQQNLRTWLCGCVIRTTALPRYRSVVGLELWKVWPVLLQEEIASLLLWILFDISRVTVYHLLYFLFVFYSKAATHLLCLIKGQHLTWDSFFLFAWELTHLYWFAPKTSSPAGSKADQISLLSLFVSIFSNRYWKKVSSVKMCSCYVLFNENKRSF